MVYSCAFNSLSDDVWSLALNDQKRAFNGVWIPKWLYTTKGFTWTEKLLILEIYYLDHGSGCFASNRHFADFFHISIGRVKQIVKGLKEKGVIEEVRKDGVRRLLSISENFRSFFGTDPERETKPQVEEEPEGEVEIKPGKDDPEPISMSEKEIEKIETIFEFWNSYKGSGPWKSHIKISYDIKSAIHDAISHYSVDEVCEAIANYAKILIGDQYQWNHPWPISTFFTVKYGNNKDAPRKWWQFLSENFIESNYLKKQDNQIEDGYQELTQRIIRLFSRLNNNLEFKPSNEQMVKFIEASRRMTKFFEGKKGIMKEDQIGYLRGCMRKNFLDIGRPLYPGNLCSENTWEILMPQYLAEIGA